MNPKKRAMLRDPKIFSMSSIRDVTARMVSAFFYSSPHSPPCARKDSVVSDGNKGALALFRCLFLCHTPVCASVCVCVCFRNLLLRFVLELCLSSTHGCVATTAVFRVLSECLLRISSSPVVFSLFGGMCTDVRLEEE